MIDTHAHLDMEPLRKDLGEVLARARAAGVEAIVTIGTDLTSSEDSVDLAGREEDIYATVGVHPHETSGMFADALPRLRTLCRNPRVVAIGEIGLDYHYLHSPRDIQVARFADQIRLAREVGLPIVVHSRDSGDDLLKVLHEEKGWEAGGVLHCYTGDQHTARTVVDMGFYISFSGILTFPKAKDLRDVARAIPHERLLIETDSPYLAPVPVRGKRNEPAFIRHTLSMLADIIEKPIELVESVTTANARRLFRLPEAPR